VEKPLIIAVERLARAGQDAGFSVEQMIQELQSGMSVETLLRMIEWRLFPVPIEARSSRWVI
jgi:hypothetical protein